MADGQEKPSGDDWRASMREVGPYLGLGMQLAATLVVFMLGGYFLDRRLETLPWLTIAGALVGLVLLFLRLYRTAIELSRPSEQQRKKQRPKPGQ